jgi:PAS domain S-box-containing protein
MNSSISVLAVISLVTYLSYAGLYGTMALFDRSRTLGLFFFAIVFALLSAVFDAFSANGTLAVQFEITVLSAFASALAMLAGSYRLAGRAIPRSWFYIGAASYVLHLLPYTLVDSLTPSLIPSTTFIIAVYLATARLFWSLGSTQRNFARCSALLLVANSLFQIQYPFVRDHLQTWQYATQLVIGQFTMLSFLVLYHRNKNHLLEQARTVLCNYIRTSPIGIIVTNREYAVKNMNLAAEQALSYTAEELAGRTFQSLLAEPPANDGLPNNTTAPLHSSRRELMLRKKDGRQFPCRVTQSVQENGDIIIFCEDVSDERLAQREKADLQQLVFQSSKLASLGELAASVAHEINTPLAVIKGAADLLRTAGASLESKPLAFRNNMHRIDFGVRRIDTIVKSMLSIARNGNMESDLVDLRDCIEDTVTFMTVLLNKDQIQVSVDLGPTPLPVWIRVDEVNQILTNLMTNARDALEGSPVKRIGITTRVNSSAVELLVTDSGCGISPEQSTRVFERFFTTKQGRGGTGLGLAISRKMALSNNGELRFSSAPGNGTTFILSLPLHQESGTLMKPSLNEDAPGAKRVLIVDDEPTILDVMEEFLTSEGYAVKCVSTVGAAIEALQQQPFDLVFTDYLLKSEKGSEVVNFCRSRFARDACRVFVMSGYAEERPQNADGYINKPFGLQEIREILGSPFSASTRTIPKHLQRMPVPAPVDSHPHP